MAIAVVHMFRPDQYAPRSELAQYERLAERIRCCLEDMQESGRSAYFLCCSRGVEGLHRKVRDCISSSSKACFPDSDKEPLAFKFMRFKRQLMEDSVSQVDLAGVSTRYCIPALQRVLSADYASGSMDEGLWRFFIKPAVLPRKGYEVSEGMGGVLREPLECRIMPGLAGRGFY